MKLISEAWTLYICIFVRGPDVSFMSWIVGHRDYVFPSNSSAHICRVDIRRDVMIPVRFYAAITRNATRLPGVANNHVAIRVIALHTGTPLP